MRASAARGRAAAASVAVIAVSALGFGCGSDASTAGSAAASLPDDRLTVAAAGDIGMEQPGVATLRAMAASEPDLYLGLGDLSYAGPGSEDEFCDLVHSIAGPEARFEIVSGNHEEDTGEDGRIDRFASCLPDRAGAEGDYGAQYYFDVGRLARFIMIAPDLTIDGVHHYYGPDGRGGETPQLRWLREAIEGARSGGVRWVIVGMHKNCISVGEYYCDVYQDLFTALIEEGVDLVLSGHDHSYQRSKQIAAGPSCPTVVVDRFNPSCVVDGGDRYEKGAGTAFVIAGVGGGELYPVYSGDREAGYFATAMGRNTSGSRNGFVRLAITPGRLALDFVGSTPGRFGDGFEIAAPPRAGG